MCGVLFLYDTCLTPEECRARGGQALLALAHRGPDEGADAYHAGAWLGHRRLSIIDLGSSKQPMFDPEGRHALSYNGEIYNYRELREELLGKWTFRTSGDTEVLLAGLVTKGPKFLDRMEGMWAFVLWDAKQRRLLAARDRFGKKPLYFAVVDRRMACASELPALKRLLAQGSWSEDLDSTADYFRYGYALPGKTAFVGINEILPGHWLEWRAEDGALSQRRYWSLPAERFGGSVIEGEELLRSGIHRAVARRMVADIEVGCLLSGGIDSTIVASQAAALAAPRRLKTFTVSFADASYDESPFARAVASELQCEHHEEVLASHDPDTIQGLIARHFGQPFADPSVLPTALVSRLAARSVKVALSGDGADEVFCGYERYRARVILRWYTRIPVGLRGIAEQAILRLSEPTAHHSGSLRKKAHLFIRQIRQWQRATPYVAPELFAPEWIERLLPDLAKRGHAAPELPAAKSPGDIEAMMRTDALVYLPQDILQKTDRASMAHSLELRAPFLDSDLVTLAYSFPTNWHAGLVRGKRLLRRAARDLLPDPVARRGKQGFSVPVGDWFRGALGDLMPTMLTRDPGPLDPTVAAKLLREHRSGSRDHGLQLWAIYVYLTCRDQRLWSGAYD